MLNASNIRNPKTPAATREVSFYVSLHKMNSISILDFFVLFLCIYFNFLNVDAETTQLRLCFHYVN